MVDLIEKEDEIDLFCLRQSYKVQYKHTHTHTHRHTDTHTQTHRHTHTQIHTRIHTQTHTHNINREKKIDIQIGNTLTHTNLQTHLK